MRHQIPSLLAITLIVSVSFLMGQLVVNQSQSIQTEYDGMNLGSSAAQSTTVEVK